MVAGYDTTSSTMSYCFHALINNPDEVARLQEEIDAKFSAETGVKIKKKKKRK